jgi:hypothetical protein
MMTRTTDRERYQAYLVRLWREQPGAGWRAGIEIPHTGERRAFGSLEALFEYLSEQTAGRGRQPDEEDAIGPLG